MVSYSIALLHISTNNLFDFLLHRLKSSKGKMAFYVLSKYFGCEIDNSGLATFNSTSQHVGSCNPVIEFIRNKVLTKLSSRSPTANKNSSEKRNTGSRVLLTTRGVSSSSGSRAQSSSTSTASLIGGGSNSGYSSAARFVTTHPIMSLLFRLNSILSFFVYISVFSFQRPISLHVYQKMALIRLNLSMMLMNLFMTCAKQHLLYHPILTTRLFHLPK